MGNSLVEAKKAGEKHLEVLLAGEMSGQEQARLHEIERELTSMFTGLESTKLAMQIKQASLLEEAYSLLGNDGMTFTAWVNKPEIGVPFNRQTAFNIRYLGRFCENKDPLKIKVGVSSLQLLSQPKWTDDSKTGGKGKEGKKAISAAYKRLQDLTPKNQTVAKTKEVIKEEMDKAGIVIATKTPPKWKVGQAEDAADRLLVKIFQSFEGMPEIMYLKQHILKEMQGW